VGCAKGTELAGLIAGIITILIGADENIASTAAVPKVE
jgi:hypothetical protein